jgi:hypothetical protein
MCNYGGWYILVAAAADGQVERDSTYRGWTVVPPVGAAPGAAGSTSTYATTAVVPPVPPGSAVEFAVDYIANTCRVAFYTAAAVVTGFAEAPHAKMAISRARLSLEWATHMDASALLSPRADAVRAEACSSCTCASSFSVWRWCRPHRTSRSSSCRSRSSGTIVVLPSPQRVANRPTSRRREKSALNDCVTVDCAAGKCEEIVRKHHDKP